MFIHHARLCDQRSIVMNKQGTAIDKYVYGEGIEAEQAMLSGCVKRLTESPKLSVEIMQKMIDTWRKIHV